MNIYTYLDNDKYLKRKFMLENKTFRIKLQNDIA